MRRGHLGVRALRHDVYEVVPSAQGVGFRCDRCHSITPYNLCGLCPTNGCEGRLSPLDPASLAGHHYRALYLGLEPTALRSEEHTAQWSAEEASRVQQQFIEGHINVLSCSTTFEMGVDVGDLHAVLMRNVPPATANYVQRAGRAGRRVGGAAFALTFAQRRSHDLMHYADPERIVSGKVPVPRVTVRNAKIVRRHAQAVLIAAFLRREAGDGRRFKNAGAFFEVCDAALGSTAAERLRAYAEAHPPDVQQALLRIVPEALHTELRIETWAWLESETGMLELLDRVSSEVREDLGRYEALVREVVAESEQPGVNAGRFLRMAAAYREVQRTIRSRSLIGFLASRNLLPKYGFPTDVVPLRTDHVTEERRSTLLELERDLRIAISEYAPRIAGSGGRKGLDGRRACHAARQALAYVRLRRLPGVQPLPSATRGTDRLRMRGLRGAFAGSTTLHRARVWFSGRAWRAAQARRGPPGQDLRLPCSLHRVCS